MDWEEKFNTGHVAHRLNGHVPQPSNEPKKLCLWACAHKPTEEQLKELDDKEIIHLPEELRSQLTNCPPDKIALKALAKKLLLHIEETGSRYVVLPIGSPHFMWQFALLFYTRKYHVRFLFAHSERKSVEEVLPDGSVSKKSVFAHQGFFVDS